MADKKDEPKKSEAKPAAKPAAEDALLRQAQDVIWIVNPHGAVHQVSRAHARERFRSAGWRKATAAEIPELGKRGGRQEWDDPIAEPWSPEPEAEPEV